MRLGKKEEKLNKEFPFFREKLVFPIPNIFCVWISIFIAFEYLCKFQNHHSIWQEKKNIFTPSHLTYNSEKWFKKWEVPILIYFKFSQKLPPVALQQLCKFQNHRSLFQVNTNIFHTFRSRTRFRKNDKWEFLIPFVFKISQMLPSVALQQLCKFQNHRSLFQVNANIFHTFRSSTRLWKNDKKWEFPFDFLSNFHKSYLSWC